MRAIHPVIPAALAALMVAGCTPRGVSGTDGTQLDGGDADTDADADSDTDADADADTDTDTDTDTYYQVDCSAGPAATGPWPEHPISVAGAPITYDPYTFDAGVGAVLAATVGLTAPAEVNLPVNGAIVTARGYVPAVNDGTVTFWFEDGSGPMLAYRVNLGGVDPATLEPGDEVAFIATRVTDYFGTPEVAGSTDPKAPHPGISNFTVLSKGNPVHVVDVMGAGAGAPITFAEHGLHVVEVWGELAAGPVECGGASCFDYEYAGNVVEYRTSSAFDYVGDCKHYIGPVTQYFDEPRLDVVDFDWAWRY